MLKQNISLKDYSNYRIGGPAAYFLEIKSEADLIYGINEWEKVSKNFSENQKKIFILGKGTNILISEKGFDGLIIHNSINGIKLQNNSLEVGSGALLSEILDFCIQNSLSGMEWAGGLPGTIGGAVRGNAGAFKGETKDSVSEVYSLNLTSLMHENRLNEDCKFDYRTSIFKTKATDEIILSVELNFKKGNQEHIKKSIQEKIDYRNEKHPMDLPSIGSTFKNIPVESVPKQLLTDFSSFIKNDPFPVVPVAKLLYLCDLKGKRQGDAQISQKHPNFIVNLGNAKSDDVKFLIEFAKKAVFEKFGLNLEEEIMYLGGGDING